MSSSHARPGWVRIVVGAGIAGLNAAFRLRQAGMGVTVLEKADRVGGRMLTVERDGWDPCTAARPVGEFAGFADFANQLDPCSRVQFAGDYFAITTVEGSLASGAAVASRLARLLS